MTLKGKTVLIVGASGGVGQSIARLLGKHGMNLTLVGRKKDRLNSIEKK